MDCARVARLPSGPDGAAMADALDLLSVSMCPSRAERVASRLGWWTSRSNVVGPSAPGDVEIELQGLHAPAVDAVVLPDARALTIEASMALDPPMYGRLRELAARDPRLVLALGQEPAVRVKAGWLFSRDRATAHPSVLHFRVGDVGFDLSGKDRPAWLPDLLVDLGSRFFRTDPFEAPAAVADRLLAASLSADRRQREGFERLKRAIVRPPFDVPEPGLVRGGDRLDLVFGPDLTGVSRAGRDALDAVRWMEAAFVVRPDVLVVDEPAPSDEIRAWWAGLAESDDAPVEQVWFR